MSKETCTRNQGAQKPSSCTYHHRYKETYNIIEKRPIISNETCMNVKRDCMYVKRDLYERPGCAAAVVIHISSPLQRDL